MAHIHSVYDNDTHFKIDHVTRGFSNEGSLKTLVVQNDHNSERFTFELPRYIEGHDMLLCNRVEVHYLNVDGTTKDKTSGVYEVDDLQESPEDENIAILSWLISSHATQYVGSLNFCIRFACVNEETSVLEYSWSTVINSNIHVTSGINNAEVIIQEYADVLEQWKKEILEEISSSTSGGGATTWKDLGESVVEVLNGSYEFTFNNGIYATTIEKSISITTFNNIRVVFDGVEYNNVFGADDNGSFVFGNFTLEVDGLPFMGVIGDGMVGFVDINATEAGTKTVEVYFEDVKPIDTKYLPLDIFIVNVNVDDDFNFISDKTFNEILTVGSEGKIIIMNCMGTILTAGSHFDKDGDGTTDTLCFASSNFANGMLMTMILNFNKDETITMEQWGVQMTQFL